LKYQKKLFLIFFEQNYFGEKTEEIKTPYKLTPY